MNNNLMILGIAFILIGFFIVFLSGSNSNVKSAGGVFIGPIPLFGFGEKKLFYFLWALAALIFFVFLFLRK